MGPLSCLDMSRAGAGGFAAPRIPVEPHTAPLRLHLRR
jgi:hypothetical protein